METTYIDRLTVIAIAVIAYATLNITHEIIGHCDMALVMGTKCTVLSSFYIPLASVIPIWKYNIIVVAGSTANFALGLGCLAALRRGKRQEADGVRQGPKEGSRESGVGSQGSTRRTVQYFLWLLMSVNLFLASTYIMAAPIIKFGDSYILIQNLSGQIFWRPAVALLGATVGWFSFRVCRIELARLIGMGGRHARATAWQLVVPAYLAGGILWVASASLSRLDWRIAQLEAVGGTFGLTIGLLLLPFFIPRTDASEEEPLVIRRSVGWIVAGALTALFFIGLWGSGVAV